MTGESLRDGVYVPIVFGAAVVVYLWVTRWLYPLMRSGGHTRRTALLGFSSLFAMLAHAIENTLFGIGRWLGFYSSIDTWHTTVTVGKLLIMLSIACALAAFSATPGAHWRPVLRVSVVLCVLWLAASLVDYVRDRAKTTAVRPSMMVAAPAPRRPWVATDGGSTGGS